MLLMVLAMATMPKPLGAAMPGDLGAYASLNAETRAASTRIDLTVDATGQAIRCEVTRSDGSRALDRVACEFLMRRARFRPALDAAGVPMVAVLREDFTVNRGDGVRSSAATAQLVDYAIPVDRLPRGGAVAVVDVVLTTDAAGHVSGCDVATSSTMAQLDRLACRQMQATPFAPARDRQGQPVTALRQVSVGFTAEGALAK